MKKQIMVWATFVALIQLAGCSEGSNEIVLKSENDSLKITQENGPAGKFIKIGGNDFAAIALNGEETKQALLDGSEWLWFGTFPKNSSDAVLLANYLKSIEEKKDGDEAIEDSLYFSAPDKYVHTTKYQQGKRSFTGNASYSFDKKNNMQVLKGNFQVTDQHNLILNEEKGHERNEQLSIAALDTNAMFTEEAITFEGKTILAYKRFIRTGENKK